MKNILLKGLLALVSFVLLSSSASAMTCTTLTKSLARGSSDSEVLMLQQFLFDGGYLTAKPNGFFGSGTVAALKKFQIAQGMSPVGTTGPKTRGKVKEVSCGNGVKDSSTSAIKKVDSGDLSTIPQKKTTPEVVTLNTGKSVLGPDCWNGTGRDAQDCFIDHFLDCSSLDSATSGMYYLDSTKDSRLSYSYSYKVYQENANKCGSKVTVSNTLISSTATKGVSLETTCLEDISLLSKTKNTKYTLDKSSLYSFYTNSSLQPYINDYISNKKTQGDLQDKADKFNNLMMSSQGSSTLLCLGKFIFN